MLLCLHNTLHLQRFLVPNPMVVDLLQRSIVGTVATACSPVKDIHQHHEKDIHQHHDTLTDIHTYICTHCVIASPLHQYASTLLAWTPCYCTRCRDPMYPCVPCWSICNRPASPMRCLRPISWHAHTVLRHTGIARPASTLFCQRTRAGKPAKGWLPC